LLQRGYGARGDVRGGADLERDAVLGEVGEKQVVLGRRGPVPDALGAEVEERRPDGLRAGRLARVRHRVQTGRTRGVEGVLELRPRHADLRPTQTEADEARRG